MIKQLNDFYKGVLHSPYTVVKIVDGDGIVVENIFSKKCIEIRLLGIDAPEIKICRKLKQDERETHLPGTLLLQLGRSSFDFFRTLLPIGSKVSFYTEALETDIYGRTLAYVFTEDGTCINEVLVKEGYAKAFNKYHCSQISKYLKHQLKAKMEKRGHFSLVQHF